MVQVVKVKEWGFTGCDHGDEELRSGGGEDHCRYQREGY